MKNAAVQNRMTRIQVQEKFKKNFQALCAQCPQLAKNHDTLDDSLTSLQWLWNLNVNISNPTDKLDKNIALSRNTGLLPSFPRSLTDIDHNLATVQHFSVESHSLPNSLKSNLDKNNSIHVTPPLNFANLTAHLSNGAIRALPKNGKKTSVQVVGRPSPPATQTHRYARYSQSNHSIKKLRKGQEQSSPLAKSGSNSNESDAKSDISFNTILPEIRIANLAKANDDSSTSDKSPPRHYSFSPREAMLDVLPGQVDYKNNPYVKPTFSYTTLICMALKNTKNHRLSSQGVCKWIADNFMYYRYADPGWQNSIKTNLTQSKYFSKVHKKKDSPNCLYELGRDYDLKLRDDNSPLLNGDQQESSPRLEPVSNHLSPTSSLSIPTLNSLLKQENDDLNNRKRKQTMPQKLIRRRNGCSKKRKNSQKTSENQNLLQEEAPELGSLKGDFNWNTIFDEFFGAAETDLNTVSTSLSSRSSTNDRSKNQEAVGRFSDDVVTGSLLAHDILLSPEETKLKTTSEFSKSNVKSKSWQSSNDCSLHPVNESSVIDRDSKSLPSSIRLLSTNKCNTNDDDLPCNFGHDTFGCFLNQVPELDLPINEPIINSSSSWNFLNPDFDDLLSDKPKENLLNSICPTEEIDRLFSSSSENLSVPETKSDISAFL